MKTTHETITTITFENIEELKNYAKGCAEGDFENPVEIVIKDESKAQENNVFLIFDRIYECQEWLMNTLSLNYANDETNKINFLRYLRKFDVETARFLCHTDTENTDEEIEFMIRCLKTFDI